MDCKNLGRFTDMINGVLLLVDVFETLRIICMNSLDPYWYYTVFKLA